MSLSGRPDGPLSTAPAAPLSAEKESTSNPTPGSADALPSSAAVCVTVPKPAVAPVVFVSSVSSAPTVLVVGAGNVVTQPPPPSTAISETSKATPLTLQPAASPGSTPQDVPSPDPSAIIGVASAQVKVGCCCSFMSVDYGFSGSNYVFFVFFKFSYLLYRYLSVRHLLREQKGRGEQLIKWQKV